MQTVKSREPETAPLPEPPEDKKEAKPERAPRYQPGKAALLSLVPGLGHFYVGQPVVGSLVLVSSLMGLTFLTTIIAGRSLFPVVAPIAELIGIHLDKAAGAPQVVVSPIPLTLFILTILYLGAFFAADAYQQALRKSRFPEGYKSEGVTFTGSTSFSYLVHCTMLVICAVTCLFIVKVPVKTDTVIEIELEPPPIEIPPPPPPASRPKPKAEAPKVEKHEPVKPVQPPKPVPIAVKPVESPVADNPNPEPVTQPEQGSSQGTGTQGTGNSGTGTGSGDSGTGTSDEVDLSDYIAAMEKKIRKSWFPPKGEETKKIVLKFKINGQGAASSIRLKASSGIMVADEAAMTAIKTASPFAPLPKGAPDPVEILFTFDYNVFGGKTAK